MIAPALLERIKNGRTDLVYGLGADVLRQDGGELLVWCTYFGDVTACRVLLEAGQSLDLLGADLGLNGAAFHGHWQLCEFLLERGASARFADPTTGETPLHSALTNEDRQRYDLVVKVLLRAGADPGAATKPGAPTGAFMRDATMKGETPLHRAALFGMPSTIALLLEAGASREARDAFGETPLAWASWARRPTEVLRPLLYGEHRIHPGNQPMRVNLLGKPQTSNAEPE
jgi:hypothetical protein